MEDCALTIDSAKRKQYPLERATQIQFQATFPRCSGFRYTVVSRHVHTNRNARCVAHVDLQRVQVSHTDVDLQRVQFPTPMSTYSEYKPPHRCRPTASTSHLCRRIFWDKEYFFKKIPKNCLHTVERNHTIPYDSQQHIGPRRFINDSRNSTPAEYKKPQKDERCLYMYNVRDGELIGACRYSRNENTIRLKELTLTDSHKYANAFIFYVRVRWMRLYTNYETALDATTRPLFDMTLRTLFDTVIEPSTIDSFRTSMLDDDAMCAQSLQKPVIS